MQRHYGNKSFLLNPWFLMTCWGRLALQFLTQHLVLFLCLPNEVHILLLLLLSASSLGEGFLCKLTHT